VGSLLVRGFALCVQADVFVEVAGVSERTEAELALQWFVSGVGPAKGDSMVYFNKQTNKKRRRRRRSNIFLQKLIVAQLVKKLPNSY
jgi:hypothetical protein